MSNESDDFIPTRRSLLSRLRNWDDQESWKDFFDTYWRLVYRVAIKAGLDPSEAEDAVQETVWTVAKNIKDFHWDPKKGKFKGWLLKITRWRIADMKRRRLHEVLVSETVFEGLANDAPPNDSDDCENGLGGIWEEEWAHNLIYAATERVKRLVKPKQYQAYDFHILKEMPVQQVARRLNMHVGQVYYAVYKVGAAMKRELRRLQQDPGWEGNGKA
jgi:RNA polymerase sigma-70 factor (ECF subfamily)